VSNRLHKFNDIFENKRKNNKKTRKGKKESIHKNENNF
jgi:hypothetical protein